MPYVNSGEIGIDLSLVSSNRDFTLGQVVSASDSGEYVYVFAVAAQTTGACVGIDSGFTAAALTTTLARTRPLAFVQAAFAASQYGWVAKSGVGIKIRTAASTLPGVPLFTSDTAGVLDDATASASHMQVFGVVLFATQSVAGDTAGQASNPLVRFPA